MSILGKKKIFMKKRSGSRKNCVRCGLDLLGTLQKSAFTLAEVLITLGIIGVVASLTMPALIDNHNKKLVETRLEKFYSSINQAIKMAELDYGAREDWFEDNSDYDAQKAWCEKYIIPYMNVTKTGKVNSMFTIYFADGSAVSMSTSNGRDWFFFPWGNPSECFANYNYPKAVGRCAFAFYYNPNNSSNTGINFFETYISSANSKSSEDYLKSHTSYGCSSSSSWPAYCTRWIQYNGWKIPKDYPFRLSKILKK